jgi:hypothetical protein
LQAAIGYHGKVAHGVGTERTTGGADIHSTTGLRLCKRHQSSSQQWLYSALLAASTTTSNVVSSAQVQASRLLKSLVLIAQVQWSWALLLACFATTQASQPAAKLNNRAFAGASFFGKPPVGTSPWAVFAF